MPVVTKLLCQRDRIAASSGLHEEPAPPPADIQVMKTLLILAFIALLVWYVWIRPRR